MSGNYSYAATFEQVGLEAARKSDFAKTSPNPYPVTSGVVIPATTAACIYKQQMTTTQPPFADKRLLYGIVDRLDNGNGDNPERREANRRLVVCGKNLVNNKQKQCEDDYDGEDDEQERTPDESTPKAENLKYSSMLNNPFMEKKTDPEHGRTGGEDRNHAVRLLCDNNRNRKDSFPNMISGGANGNWNGAAPQDVVDVNENFMEPVVHHKLRMAYVEQHSATTNNHSNVVSNSKGCYSTARFGMAGPVTAQAAAAQEVARPKRPQSIPVGNNAFNHHRDQFKGFISDGRSSGITNGRMLDANLASLGFSVFKAGLEPDDSSVAVHDQQRGALRGAPIVPHRRSQSTPRPAHNGHNMLSTSSTGGNNSLATTTTHSVSEAKKKSENRPKSLDRGVTTYLENVTVQSSVNFNVMHSTMYNQFATNHRASAKELLAKNGIGGMKSSATFHGQCYLSTEAELGGIGGGGGGGTLRGGRINHEGIRQPSNRPLSYTGGSISEQAFLENQLRVYSEQLKTITESVRQYSEKAKLLSELKRQELLKNNNKKANGYSMPTSKSDSKLSLISLSSNSDLTNPPLNPSHKQTSSHQLRLFLEDIRSNIRDSSVNSSMDLLDEQVATIEEVSNNAGPAASTTGPLPLPLIYADPMRKIPSQQPPPIPERKRQTPSLTDKNAPALSAAAEPECKPDFKQAGNPLLNSISSSNNTNGTTKILRSNEMDFNQILDNFNCATKRFMGTNRADYREDYLTAMQRTSHEIRQAAQNIKRNSGQGQQDPAGNGGGSSDENSSTSTTPGSIREAVQSLLAMPRNGVQVMDDRMRLFIDILESQDKFNQVETECLFMSHCYRPLT